MCVEEELVVGVMESRDQSFWSLGGRRAQKSDSWFTLISEYVSLPVCSVVSRSHFKKKAPSTHSCKDTCFCCWYNSDVLHSDSSFILPRELSTNAKSLAGFLFQCTWQIIPGTVVYVKIPTLAVC